MTPTHYRVGAIFVSGLRGEMQLVHPTSPMHSPPMLRGCPRQAIHTARCQHQILMWVAS